MDHRNSFFYKVINKFNRGHNERLKILIKRYLYLLQTVKITMVLLFVRRDKNLTYSSLYELK